jgi:DNA polymerase III, chi subunit
VTQVDFYVHVDDKVRTAVRLAAKAYQRGRKLTVFCPDAATAERFDRTLWTSPALSFIPHCHAHDAAAPVTPIIIDCTGDGLLNDDILLNLCGERPQHFSRYQRLIEIVASDDEDRRLARDRYKFYRDRGYEIRTHDLAQAGGAH